MKKETVPSKENSARNLCRSVLHKSLSSKKYLTMFRIKLIAAMQYRVAAWAGIATQLFWGFIRLMVFVAFYKDAKELPMPLEQLAGYLWLTQAFLALIMLWWQDNELFDLIENGNLAYELCRPLNLYKMWFARLTALRVARVSLRCVPILIISILLPRPYGLALPSLISLIAFLLSLVLALFLVVAISMFIYLITMVTLSSTGVRNMFSVAADFLTGSLLPIPLMPLAMQKIIFWLPFRYIADFPFRVCTGNLTGAEIVTGLVIQLGWLAVLLVVGQLTFSGRCRRLVIQGG